MIQTHAVLILPLQDHEVADATVHAFQRWLVHHQTAIQNVSSMQIVQKTELVLIKSVLTHVQACADKMRIVKLGIIFRYAYVTGVL